MGLVILVSGGVDSTVISLLAARDKITTYPLFVDYGQLCVDREWSACLEVHKRHNLPTPIRMNLAGFGHIVSSGLTDAALDVLKDAFLPCRNLLFAICGASYAHTLNLDCVALGLIDESAAIFPDQTSTFLEQAQKMIHTATGRTIRVIAPLLSTSKAEVLAIAAYLGVTGTYSCHSGGPQPCGQCVSCLEQIRAGKLAQ